MSKINDQNYLLQDQYKDATNLDARVRLHLLFSTNQYGWHRWCFDRYALPAQASVLELGCGPAYLWTANLDRLPPGWRITLSDLSGGMLEQARRNLGVEPPASATLHFAHAVSQPKAGRRARRHTQQFCFEIVDAQQIPFESNTFDAVIANHMLYHVPDRTRALSEMQRMLKPDGLVYLATNGRSHLRELHELEQRFDFTIDFGWSGHSREFFSLDEGRVEVERFFQDVQIVRYEDALNITTAEPLVDYILSMATAPVMQQCHVDLLRFIEGELAQHGAIHITKESGMFIGKNALRMM